MAKVQRAKEIKKPIKKKKISEISLPFSKENYYLLLIGIAVIVFGYVLMDIGGAYDALALVCISNSLGYWILCCNPFCNFL